MYTNVRSLLLTVLALTCKRSRALCFACRTLSGEGRCEGNLRFWSLGRGSREALWDEASVAGMQKIGEEAG